MAKFTSVPMTAGRHGKTGGEPGLRVRRHRSSLLVSVMARRGATAALSAMTNNLLAAELPTTPRWVAGRNANLIWNGPGHWLLESSDPTLTYDALAASLAAAAAVVDQTDSRVMIDVAGPRVRDALAKGLPIDLDPTRFRVRDVALTSASHIAVAIWQLDASPTYRLSIARSYFASFWQWLEASAAEYGCEVSPSGA